jgi:hypothetical protein
MSERSQPHAGVRKTKLKTSKQAPLAGREEEKEEEEEEEFFNHYKREALTRNLAQEALSKNDRTIAQPGLRTGVRALYSTTFRDDAPRLMEHDDAHRLVRWCWSTVSVAQGVRFDRPRLLGEPGGSRG